MSFETKGFATIRICSTNVAKSAVWYRRLFGLDPVEETENFVSFRIQGTCLDISSADIKSPSSQGGSVGYWFVDNLDGAIERALELGGEIYRGPLRVDEIQRTIVQVKDPYGNVIGFEAAV